jgi:hypothetical protein
MNDFILTSEAYNYFQGFLERLKSLFNEDGQEAAWFRGDYSKYTDFSEIYMGFADPCDDILLWPSLPATKRRSLQELAQMIDDYNTYYNNEELTDKQVYNDPKWDKIRKFAKKVYDDLKDVKYAGS